MGSRKENRAAFKKILLLLIITSCTLIAAGPPASADSENGAEPLLSKTPLEIEIAVNPDKNANCLKASERGAIKLVVLGSSALNVTGIDPDSLKISSEKNAAVVYPSAFIYEDISEDGFEDLVLEVNCHKMLVELGIRNCFCNSIPLNVRGELKDGSSEIKGTGMTLILPSLL
ncbi:MAG: hypothetical protein PHD41_02720 [Methanosarcinaceae archaeon]|nr:hypothetical protein [Methanosarcinaceae archaeon]MDD4330816.1 hypothetical protein [Methanosarcinaceae archaeon]MDD4748364.1 hypothetical protein [Methanosarcinaceae archaeon]